MTITIDDAPAVKHISIDIDFGKDGEATTIIKQDTSNESTNNVKSSLLRANNSRDEVLNLDEDFTQQNEEELVKPEIIEEERQAKVSDEMQNMEI